jgi:endonuclease-3
MSDAERADRMLVILEKEYPATTGTFLKWKTPLDLLVATILSAQSTDEQINKITVNLFKKYKTTTDYINANLYVFEEEIRSSGFYHRKAELIQTACKQIVEEFGGEVPNTMEDLLKLKGVARKTANIVLANAFGVVEGVAVDTHVMRLSQRMGFSENSDRDKIERDLMELFPQEKWHELNYILIEHGRQICDAKKALCEKCCVKELCPSAFKFRHYA